MGQNKGFKPSQAYYLALTSSSFARAKFYHNLPDDDRDGAAQSPDDALPLI
jgi:hypothetical protein